MADDTNVPTQLAESSDEIVRMREREQDLLMKLEQDACEIERLRAAGDALAKNYEIMLDDRWSAFSAAFLTAWREARRG